MMKNQAALRNVDGMYLAHGTLLPAVVDRESLELIGPEASSRGWSRLRAVARRLNPLPSFHDLEIELSETEILEDLRYWDV
jgi:hypothetical protein